MFFSCIAIIGVGTFKRHCAARHDIVRIRDAAHWSIYFHSEPRFMFLVGESISVANKSIRYNLDAPQHKFFELASIYSESQNVQRGLPRLLRSALVDTYALHHSLVQQGVPPIEFL